MASTAVEAFRPAYERTRPKPAGRRTTNDTPDELAVHLQIAEISAALDALLARKLTLQLAWESSTDDSQSESEGSTWEEDEALLRMELQQLHAQAGHLQAQAIQASAVASRRQQQQDLQLALVVADSERIAEHDRRFAQTLADMDEDEWNRIGDEVEAPLQGAAVFRRPCTPRAPASESVRASSQQATIAIPTKQARSSSSSSATSSGAGRSGPLPPPVAAPRPQPAAAGGPLMQNRGAKGKHAAVEASSAADATQQSVQGWMHKCNICLEQYPLGSMLCANRAADKPSSSTSRDSGCGHYSCRDCMQQYVGMRVQARQYPVACPTPACGGLLDHALLDDLLQGAEDDLKALQEVQMIHALGPGQYMYCPHKSCSALLAQADDLDANKPAHCPACTRVFCPTCQIAGWHKGFTCKAFQALPAHQRSAEDAAVLKLSKDKHWRPCPTCQMLVERAEGCNHVRCRCGVDFCYSCGKRYASSSPTAANVHGTPACRCSLFDVPAEDEPMPPAPPAPEEEEEEEGERMKGRPEAPFQGFGVQRGPVRLLPGNRRVSRRRCWHAESIHNCPRGDHCWFSHIEDL